MPYEERTVDLRTNQKDNSLDCYSVRVHSLKRHQALRLEARQHYDLRLLFQNQTGKQATSS